MRPTRSTERGSALLLAVIAFIVMAGVGGALFSMSVAGQKTTVNASNADVAFHVAEAGIDDALNRMRGYAAEPTNAVADYYDIFNVPSGTLSNTFTGEINHGSYTVTVEPAFVHDAPGKYTVRSIGQYQGEWRGLEVHIDAVPDLQPFQYGMFGEVFLDATGSMFSDGFSSSKGTYASQLAASTNKGGPKNTPYVNATGDVGSNGGVNVGSNKAMIFGNATPGPGYTVTGNGFISGSTTAAKAPFPLKPVTYSVPSGVTPDTKSYPTMTSSATLGSAGNTTWYVTDSMSLKSKAKIVVEGNVTIVVNGDIKLTAQSEIIIKDGATLTIYHEGSTFEVHGGTDASTGGGVNTLSRSAADFQVWSKATSATLNGNSAFYGAVYAPDAEIKMNGNAGFYGGVIGKRIDAMGDLSFHYDEDLGTINIPYITIDVESSKQFIVSTTEMIK